MTFAEQAAQLAKLEAVAKSLGMSAAAFERIAIDVTQEAHLSSVERTAAQVLAEIRRRVEPPGTRKRGACDGGLA